jgi:membrane peptidoglycan carboxypeptidase
MGQSKPYGYGKNETEYNYSVNSSMGGSNYGFPTGSTFKPFLAAAALEEGRPPNQSYPAPYQMPYPETVQTCSSKPWTNKDNDTVENESESEKGPYQLKKAMELSVNTYFVQMLADIGMCPVVKMTDKLGVVQGNGDKVPEVPSSMTLGSTGLSPLTMASAYAAFASRGMYCTPIAIESITQTVGGAKKSLEVPKSTCSRAMDEKTADTINTLLSGVTDSGTGKQAGLSGRANAGKTGTTDSRKNAWFVGYTPNLAGAVWVGSATQKVEMTDITIGGVYHAQVYGGDTPGPIWRDAMTSALEGKDAPSFNLVNIPDPPDKNKGNGKNNNGGGNNGGTGGDGGNNDGFLGGLLTNGTTNAGTANGGVGTYFQGQTNGNANGGGGRRN